MKWQTNDGEIIEVVKHEERGKIIIRRAKQTGQVSEQIADCFRGGGPVHSIWDIKAMNGLVLSLLNVPQLDDMIYNEIEELEEWLGIS